MANQLQWDPVEAPRLDSRGLSVAGDLFNGSMDRFGQILAQRDQRLNAKATEAGQAAMLSASSPEELAAVRAQFAAGAFGDRANGLAITQAGNQREEGILQNRARQQQYDIEQEDLLNKQAYAKLGTEGAALLNAAHGGNQAAMAEITARAQQDPLWSRVAQSYTKDANSTLDDFNKFGETKRVNDSNIKNDAIRTGIAQSAENRAVAAVKQDKKNSTMGSDLARMFRLESPDSAVAHATDWMDAHGIPDGERIKVMGQMSAIHADLNKTTDASQAGAAPVRREVSRLNTLAEGAANRQLAALDTPDAKLIDRAKSTKDVSNEQLATAANAVDSSISLNSTRKNLDKLRADYRASTGKELSNQAALALIELKVKPTQGWFNTNTDFYGQLLSGATDLATLREKTADGANTEAERAKIKGGLVRTQAENEKKFTAAVARGRAQESAGLPVTMDNTPDVTAQNAALLKQQQAEDSKPATAEPVATPAPAAQQAASPAQAVDQLPTVQAERPVQGRNSSPLTGDGNDGWRELGDQIRTAGSAIARNSQAFDTSFNRLVAPEQRGPTPAWDMRATRDRSGRPVVAYADTPGGPERAHPMPDNFWRPATGPQSADAQAALVQQMAAQRAAPAPALAGVDTKGFTTKAGDYIQPGKLTTVEMAELKSLDKKTDKGSKARVEQLLGKAY